jgi:hypothetical protein
MSDGYWRLWLSSSELGKYFEQNIPRNKLYKASVFDSTENNSFGAQSLIARQSHQLKNFVLELFVF